MIIGIYLNLILASDVSKILKSFILEARTDHNFFL